MKNRLIWVISLLMFATIFRAQTIAFLSSVEAFGGPAPDAWFGPWASDAVLGLLVPVMIFILWKGRGPRAWGALLVYNALGVFDYSHGLVTQYFSPMPIEMASPTMVYLGIGVFLAMQLIALALLFRRDVATHFWRR